MLSIKTELETTNDASPARKEASKQAVLQVQIAMKGGKVLKSQRELKAPLIGKTGESPDETGNLAIS